MLLGGGSVPAIHRRGGLGGTATFWPQIALIRRVGLVRNRRQQRAERFLRFWPPFNSSISQALLQRALATICRAGCCCPSSSPAAHVIFGAPGWDQVVPADRRANSARADVQTPRPSPVTRPGSTRPRRPAAVIWGRPTRLLGPGWRHGDRMTRRGAYQRSNAATPDASASPSIAAPNIPGRSSR